MNYSALIQNRKSVREFTNDRVSAKRLQEIAQAHGARAFLVENAENIPETLLQESTLIGITAGASTPEDIVKKIIAKLQQAGFSS